MDAMLSTSEVAELTGISLRHVKRLAASNKLPCEKTVNSNNRPKYLFPLSGLAALDPTLPQRYLAQHAQEGTAEGAAEPQNAKRGWLYKILRQAWLYWPIFCSRGQLHEMLYLPLGNLGFLCSKTALQQIS